MSLQATSGAHVDVNTLPLPPGAGLHAQNLHFENSNISYAGRDQYNIVNNLAVDTAAVSPYIYIPFPANGLTSVFSRLNL
jgi:hypothetical protein